MYPSFSIDGAIASSNGYATEAAKDILLRGGNAFDASIALQAVLCVTEPFASGIGGGLFAVYYDANDETIYALDGREECKFMFCINVST